MEKRQVVLIAKVIIIKVKVRVSGGFSFAIT